MEIVISGLRDVRLYGGGPRNPTLRNPTLRNPKNPPCNIHTTDLEVTPDHCKSLILLTDDR